MSALESTSPNCTEGQIVNSYKKKLLFTQGDVSKYSFIRLDFKKVAKIVTKNSLDFKNSLKINCFTHAENHINSLISSSIHS